MAAATEPDSIVTDCDLWLWAKDGSFKNGPLDWYKVGSLGEHRRHDGFMEVIGLRGALACEVLGNDNRDGNEEEEEEDGDHEEEEGGWMSGLGMNMF